MVERKVRHQLLDTSWLFTVEAILGVDTQHFLTMIEQVELNHLGPIPLVTVSFMATFEVLT